ncbi:MAG: hypothetical protein ACRDJP_10690, partial [Actinomycetota bacterium]
MRAMRAVLVSMVVLLGLPGMAGARDATRAPGRGEAPKSAALPNFRAAGANLIRLQAGAFDPLQDPLPIQPGV